MKLKYTLGSLLVALALIAAGCGDSDPERDQALVDAMVDDILDDEGSFTQDKEEATCVAESTYDALGSDRLTELGVTVENPDPSDVDLSDDEIDKVVDSVFDCVDMKQSLVDEIQGDDISQEDAECLADAIGDDGLRDMSRQGFGSDTGPTAEFIEILTKAATDCGVPLN